MDWKKLLPIAGIILLIYILWRFDIEKIISLFSTIHPLYAILCFLGYPLLLVVMTIEWQVILKQQSIQVSFVYSLKNTLIGYFYGFITPGGLGSYLRALYLKQESHAPLPKCISNIVTINALDLITVFSFSSIGGLFLLGQNPYLFIISMVILLTIIVLFIFFLRQKKSRQLFNRLLATQIFQIIQRYMDDPIETFYDDLPSIKNLRIPFVISIICCFVFYTELYFIAQLFAIHLPFFTMLFMCAIAGAVATLPISVHGLGTRDAALVALLSLYGVPPENSISFTLFWFTIFWVTPSIIGAFITVVENKKFPAKNRIT